MRPGGPFCTVAMLVYRFRSRRVRRIVRRAVLWVEGGECYSDTIRRLFLKYHGIRVGMYSYGGCFDPDNLPSGTVVGRYCSCAKFRVYSRNHPIGSLSTHPFFYNRRFGYVSVDPIEPGHLEVGHDVWIGDQALVLPSVRSIGNGAVVGAGTVVTKDVPPFAVVAGNPGRVVKYRFPDDSIRRIELMKWWDRSIEENLRSVDAFTQPYKQEHGLEK